MPSNTVQVKDVAAVCSQLPEEVGRASPPMSPTLVPHHHPSSPSSSSSFPSSSSPSPHTHRFCVKTMYPSIPQFNQLKARRSSRRCSPAMKKASSDFDGTAINNGIDRIHVPFYTVLYCSSAVAAQVSAQISDHSDGGSEWLW